MCKIRHFLAIGLLTACMMPSCKSDDEPESAKATYRPAGINIKNATALINYSGDGARAVQGDFDHAGLYKLNPDGTIEAIAVTFYVDEDDNIHNNEVTLSVSTTKIINAGKNFIGMSSCQYYDKDGDAFFMHDPMGQSLNTQLIVDKRNDKIYALDGTTKVDTAQVDIYRMVEENDKSLILVSSRLNVYRMTFSNNNVDVRRLNNNRKGIYPENIVPMPDGSVYSSAYALSDINVIYPNGGYDIIGNNCALLKNGDILTVSSESTDFPYNTTVKINIGKLNISQGQPTQIIPVAETSFSSNNFEGFGGGWCESPSNIIFGPSQYSSSHKYLVMDRKTSSLNVVNLEEHIELASNRMFGDRCWELKLEGTDRPKVLWLNPESMQTGAITVNIPGFDIDSYKTQEDYEAGKIVLYGTLRADGSNCVASIDLSTEKCEIVAAAPSHTTITLTPLN